MQYTVFVTPQAERDLENLKDYIALHDDPAKAEHVVDRLEPAISKLAKSPERGARVRELQVLGIAEFREVFFKPYRIIYKLVRNEVHVALIADGRRDMQSLLQRRLFNL